MQAGNCSYSWRKVLATAGWRTIKGRVCDVWWEICLCFRLGIVQGMRVLGCQHLFWALTADVKIGKYCGTCSRYEGVTSRLSDEVRSVCRWRQRLPRSRTPGRERKQDGRTAAANDATVETKTASGVRRGGFDDPLPSLICTPAGAHASASKRKKHARQSSSQH